MINGAVVGMLKSSLAQLNNDSIADDINNSTETLNEWILRVANDIPPQHANQVVQEPAEENFSSR